MKQNDPTFQETLREATDWLIKEFQYWNNAQADLVLAGYRNNFFDDKAFMLERGAYRAVAERFVLEDIDWKDWQWLETPWAGTDANTGEQARILYFTNVNKNSKLRMAIFYVAHNRHGWYALPLAEFQDYMGLRVYEVNTIQRALDVMRATVLP